MEQFQSYFFVIGLVVVMTYAWQRFNEPSFPQREDLPRTVDPLRYLFMRSTYGKARIGYVAGLMALYALLVAPGPTMVETLGQAGIKDFPPKAWPLLIALVLTSLGTVPASLKWLNVIEEWLRQWVHSWFLVPDGMKRTIGVLEDARYDPPPSQLNLVENTATRERLQENLNAPTGTLRYRWARTAVLMVSLRQMGAGAPHPLARAAFAPFEEDFKAILASYRALRPDVEALFGNPMGGGDAEENLLASVDSLLRRIYTYISWGLLQQADHEGDIDQTLEELGFRIPKTRGRRLADIVVPAVLPVALITMAFWVFLDAGRWMMGWDAGKQTSDVVLDALSSAIAAAVMYGAAVFIALKGRATQIEEKTWRDGSARCLIPIALKAGLVTCGVIVAVAVIYDFSQISRSLIAMVQGAKLFISGAPADATTDGWDVLRNNVVTALPWMLVGGTTSAMLAILLSGDVRRTDRSQRIREAIVLGIAVAVAAAVAQFMTFALLEKLAHKPPRFNQVPLVALAAFVSGAIVGYIVPASCRMNLVTPLDPIMTRALRNLLTQANAALGSDGAARDWVFAPNSELEGITPAEAVQYKTQATGVRRLLEAEAAHRREEARNERLPPKVIEGGRATSELSRATG